MKKTLVIYWSGTGNTEAMAGAVLEGMKAAGADASLLTPDQVTAASLSGVSSVAMGCPAMGSEVLANGCAAGRRTATMRASAWCAKASPAARLPTMMCWPPARPWAGSWRSNTSVDVRRMLRQKLLFWAAVAVLTLLAALLS